jgi:hypothetical protein
MSAPVVLVALLFWACVFMVYFATQGTTPLRYLLGRFEPLPPDLGRWKECGIDPTTGLLREERFVLPGGKPSSNHLLYQVRYRDPIRRSIERVEPEVRVRRRRSAQHLGGSAH